MSTPILKQFQLTTMDAGARGEVVVGFGAGLGGALCVGCLGWIVEPAGTAEFAAADKRIHTVPA
jgi:hypothetical protein